MAGVPPRRAAPEPRNGTSIMLAWCTQAIARQTHLLHAQSISAAIMQ